MAVTKNKRDGVLTIVNGAGLREEVLFSEGGFTYNEPEEAEPIAVQDRIGYLNHMKANDLFNGWGRTSFSFKYVDKDVKDALCTPATATSISADGVPVDYPTVNIEYMLKDNDEENEEAHMLHNVWFDPAKCVFTEGDDFSTMSAEGVIFGKYGVPRTFVTVGPVTPEMMTFTIPGQIAPSVITSTGASTGTVALTVPAGTTVTALIAYFTVAVGCTVAVSATPQVSGTTANDFTGAVDYVVTQGAVNKTWTVTVTVAT